ncbi:MAG: T9SS type A sorting domain-containing protein, partial [Prevotella sp.]|nr:T9SS type A sorting domain-containing protein [Prevotella sp.]
RQPDATMSYPNDQYGYGEIDAYRGLLYMLGLSGIKELSQSQPRQTSIVLDGKTLRVTFADGMAQNATIRIYSATGRLLLSSTDTTISLASLPAGVYAVQVTTGRAETTGSTLIRL